MFDAGTALGRVTCYVYFEDCEARRVDRGQVFQKGFRCPLCIVSGRCYDGHGGCLEEMAG